MKLIWHKHLMPGLRIVTGRESLHQELWPTWNSFSEVKQKTGQCRNERLSFFSISPSSISQFHIFCQVYKSGLIPARKSDILSKKNVVKHKIAHAFFRCLRTLPSLLWRLYKTSNECKLIFTRLLPGCLSLGSTFGVDRSELLTFSSIIDQRGVPRFTWLTFWKRLIKRSLMGYQHPGDVCICLCADVCAFNGQYMWLYACLHP